MSHSCVIDDYCVYTHVSITTTLHSLRRHCITCTHAAGGNSLARTIAFVFTAVRRHWVCYSGVVAHNAVDVS